jgi:hypothetical protein
MLTTLPPHHSYIYSGSKDTVVVPGVAPKLAEVSIGVGGGVVRVCSPGGVCVCEGGGEGGEGGTVTNGHLTTRQKMKNAACI